VIVMPFSSRMPGRPLSRVRSPHDMWRHAPCLPLPPPRLCPLPPVLGAPWNPMPSPPCLLRCDFLAAGAGGPAATGAGKSCANAPVLAPVVLPGAAATESPPLPLPSHAVLRGSVLSRVPAPVLRAPLEPDAILTVPLPLSCSTSRLQALEVPPRLEQVRPPSRVSLLRCVRRHAQASPDVLACVDTIARRDSLPPPLVCSLRRLDTWSEGFEGVCSCAGPRLALPSLQPRCPP
jgi:hypothetical protein